MFRSICANFMLFGICLAGTAAFLPPSARAESDAPSPLSIASAEALVAFSERVNAGDSFAGRTVSLEADVDLTGTDFAPIGEFGTQNVFKGVFDGQGHTVTLSLTDETRTRNLGLFGQLGGTVQNLTVTGYLSGNCVGGIASHSAGNCRIVNCASFITADANRGGGIADNLATGDILCSYSRATDSAGNAIPLCSYTANQLYLCAANGYLTSFFIPQTIKSCIEGMGDTDLNAYFCENVRTMELSGYTGLRLWSDHRPKGEKFASSHRPEGKGTRRNPYRIASIEDYAFLRNAVNGGEPFRGVSFVQTADLDFSGLENLPIGFSDTDCTFEGTYDGNGFRILHYVSEGTAHGSANAMFGNLSGIVKNLGLESGCIRGDFAASFAITATSRKATFVNCYSKLDLFGNVRTSALTDNFVGLVVGCYYRNEACDFPLAAFNTTTLAYCFNTGDLVILAGSSPFEPIECEAIPYAAFSDPGFAERLRERLPAVAELSGVKLATLNLPAADGFGAKAGAQPPSALSLLFTYRYEFAGVAAILAAAAILVFARERRQP